VEKIWIKSYSAGVPAEIDVGALGSIADYFADAAAQYAERRAFISGSTGVAITYRELELLTRHVAAYFQSVLSLPQGARVALMMPNLLQYPVCVFGLLRAGYVVVNVNPMYTARELELQLKDSGAEAMIVVELFAHVLAKVIAGTQVKHVVVTGLADMMPWPKRMLGNFLVRKIRKSVPAYSLPGSVSYRDMLARGAAARLERVAIKPQDLAFLQYTGGTTGVSKGAMLTHYNIFSNVVQTSILHKAALRRGEDRDLLVIPYFHIYGFTVGLMSGTWNGVQQILIPKYDVEALLVAIRDYRPTYFPAVPTIYISLLNHPKAKAYGIDKIRSFNCGSAPLPVEVIEQFERMTGGTLNEGYGLSEASPVTHTTPSLSRRKPGSIGIPLPDTDIKIVDLETGTEEVPAGTTGELCIAGPQVMKGYWNRPDETAIALREDGQGRVWLYTGDVARMDEDGYTYIVQRKKDMIIVSGFNVYPSEIEGVLYSHPAVMEAAVIGIPDKYRGEVVKACVVLKRDGAVGLDELRAHCEANLAEFKRPVEIELRESLPRTAVGKILHRALRDEDRARRSEQVAH